MSIIRLHNESKFYNDSPVRREVFFRLNPGDRVGLIGKNGTGKTTLLKLILAQALLSGAYLIILDEPTNHLDVTSMQVMERALRHFPGAVLVVSHDRFFIDKIATRLRLFESNGKVREVSGNWSIFQASQ